MNRYNIIYIQIFLKKNNPISIHGPHAELQAQALHCPGLFFFKWGYSFVEANVFKQTSCTPMTWQIRPKRFASFTEVLLQRLFIPGFLGKDDPYLCARHVMLQFDEIECT